MADNIDNILNTIATAVYGEDVRGGIHDGMDFIHKEYLDFLSKFNAAQDLIDSFAELDEKAAGYQEVIDNVNKALETVEQAALDLDEFAGLVGTIQPHFSDLELVVENLALLQKYSNGEGVDLTPIQKRLDELETDYDNLVTLLQTKI